jgi:hypothetical protein
VDAEAILLDVLKTRRPLTLREAGILLRALSSGRKLAGLLPTAGG